MKVKTNLEYEFTDEAKEQIKNEAIKYAIRNRRGIEILWAVICGILFLSIIVTFLVGLFITKEAFLAIAFCITAFMLVATNNALRREIIEKQEQIIELKDTIARLKNKDNENEK